MAHPMSPKHSFTNRFLGISGGAQSDLWPIWKAGSRIMSKMQGGGVLILKSQYRTLSPESLKSKGGFLLWGGVILNLGDWSWFENGRLPCVIRTPRT